MKKIVLLFLLLGCFAFAEESADLDISKLVENVGLPDTIVAPKAVDSIPKVDSALAEPSKRPGLIKLKKSGLPKDLTAGLSLFLGGGEGSPWFELGVIESIERYGVPIARVVGAGWGAWIGAVWSEGYSVKQIREWLQQADSLDPALFSKKMRNNPNSTQQQFLASWVANSDFPALDFRFSRSLDSGQQTRIVFAPEKNLNRSGRSVLSRLILQQPLLEVSHSTQTLVERLSWQVVLCNERVAKFQVTSPKPQAESIMISTGLSSDDVLKPADLCGIPDSKFFEQNWPKERWMMVLSWPERDPNIQSPMFQKELNFLSLDTSSIAVMVRPHAISQDSSDVPSVWSRMGTESMRARLGDLKGLALTERSWANRGRANGQLGTVQPAFDNVSPELQNHLSSYWEGKENWQDETVHFMDGVNQGQMYDSVNVVLQTQSASDLEDGRNLTIPVLGIQARQTPELSVRVGGFGSSIVGPLFAGSMRLRFVQQFEYDLKVSGNFGAWQKTLIPELLFSRIHGGDIAFYANVEVQEQKNGTLLQALRKYLPEQDGWITQENRMDANLQVHWMPDSWWILRSGVKIGQSDFVTPYTEYLMQVTKRPETFATVNSMDLFATWQLTQNQAPFYFENDQNRLQTQVGFRSLLIKTSGESSAPLFSRAQAKASTAFPMHPNATLGVNGSFGVEGRSGPDGWEYPDSLVIVIGYPSDPSIEDRYKMKVAATPFSSLLPIPQLNSFHYTQLGASFGFHRNGNGFWLFASWLRDYSTKNPFDLPASRVSIEPLFRFHYQSVEVLAGLHRTMASSELAEFANSKDWLAIFQVGISNF